MKINALLPLCLFLLAFSASAFVIDTDGEPIVNGHSYYILPVLRGRGGGVGLAATGNETCPLSVVQEKSEVSNGLPVTIGSLHLIHYIYEGLILYLRFLTVPPCAPKPSFWTVVEGLVPVGLSLELTGYENTLDGWFRIQKAYENTYKLEFCAHSSATCGDIGIYIDDEGVRHLVVSDVNGPFLVMFKKATASASA